MMLLGFVAVLLSGCGLLQAADPPLLADRAAFIAECIALARPGSVEARRAARAKADARRAADALEALLVGQDRMRRAQALAEPWRQLALATAPAVEASWRRMNEELSAIVDFDDRDIGGPSREEVVRHTAQALAFLDDAIEAYDVTSGAARAVRYLETWAVPLWAVTEGREVDYTTWTSAHLEDPEPAAGRRALDPSPTAMSHGWWAAGRQGIESQLDRPELAYTLPRELGQVVRDAKRLWAPLPREGHDVQTAVELAAAANARLDALSFREIDAIAAAQASQAELTSSMRWIERLAADVPGCTPSWLPGAAPPSPGSGVAAEDPAASPAASPGRGVAAPGG